MTGLPLFATRTAELLWRTDTLKQNIEFMERMGWSTKAATAELIAIQTELIEQGQTA